MAFHITNYLNCSPGSIIIRSVKYLNNKPECIYFSTSQIINKKIETPVKYTTNKAAQIPIAEVIGVQEKKSSRLWFEKYVVFASCVAFLSYFCIFRRENDIDEMLKGNSQANSPRLEILKLKTHLAYCQKNKLPTAALKARIEELEKDQQYVSPFRK